MKKIFVMLCAVVLALVSAIGCATPQDHAAATATVYRAQSLATADAHYNASLEQANHARQTVSAAEAFATATAVAVSAEATSTAVAVSARSTSAAAALAHNGTATAVANQAIATTTSREQIANATRTAVPFDAALVATRTQNEQARAWVTSFLMAGLTLATILCAFALTALIRTRARVIPRDRTGQLPAFWSEATQTLADPSRMLGPAITMPARPDALGTVARAVHYLRTGQVLPLERGRIETTDAGADADHLLAAAQASLAATATAAMFRPDLSNVSRGARVEIIKKQGLQDPWGRQISAPQTRILAMGDDAISIIAQHFGDTLPMENATIEAPAAALPQIAAPTDEEENA